jgi:hypothetical protein
MMQNLQQRRLHVSINSLRAKFKRFQKKLLGGSDDSRFANPSGGLRRTFRAATHTGAVTGFFRRNVGKIQRFRVWGTFLQLSTLAFQQEKGNLPLI